MTAEAPRWTDETAGLVRKAMARGFGWKAMVDEVVDPAVAEILAALADAGLLLPPGGQVEVQKRYVDPDGFTVIGQPDYEPDLWHLTADRTVTRWPDGRYHFGPWREVQP